MLTNRTDQSRVSEGFEMFSLESRECHYLEREHVSYLRTCATTQSNFGIYLGYIIIQNDKMGVQISHFIIYTR